MLKSKSISKMGVVQLGEFFVACLLFDACTRCVQNPRIQRRSLRVPDEKKTDEDDSLNSCESAEGPVCDQRAWKTQDPL